MHRKEGGLLVSDVKGLNTQISDLFSGKNAHLWYNTISNLIKQGAIKAFGWESIGEMEFRNVRTYEDFVASFETIERSIPWKISEDALKIIERRFKGFSLSYDNSEYIVLSLAQMGIGRVPLYKLRSAADDLGLSLCGTGDAAQIMLLSNSPVQKYIADHLGDEFDKYSITFPYDGYDPMRDSDGFPYGIKLVNGGWSTLGMRIERSNTTNFMDEATRNEVLSETEKPFIVDSSQKMLFRIKKK